MKQSSDTKVMLKEALVLFLITLAAGLILGFVYELTKNPIKAQQEKAVKEACQKVFAQAADFEVLEYTPSKYVIDGAEPNGVKIGTVYKALDSQKQILGYVVETTTTRGYGGNIVLYTGVSNTRMVMDVSILTISETPGLGMQAEKVLIPQFHEKQVDAFTFTKTGSRTDSEIDAISGATITTTAVTNAVNSALEVADECITMGGAN